MIAEDQVLDGYRLIRRIGTGGFGDVWLCEPQVMPGVRKALKWVPGAILPKLERELAALIQYQQVSQKLRHANLVPIEHVNRTPEGLFYVMPLADGLHATAPDDPAWRSASFFGLMESHRNANTWFRSQEIIHLMMPVLDALQQLSDAGIVHRDVKPENILLINSVPFLADISLLGEDTIELTHRGTPGFVAPSWYLESSGHPDQYAAAATLYCLLTGNSPDKMGRSAFRWPPGGEKTLNSEERKEWLRLHRVVYRGTHDQNSERFRDFSAMGRELKAQQITPQNFRNKAILAFCVPTVLSMALYFVWHYTQIFMGEVVSPMPSSNSSDRGSSLSASNGNSQLISKSNTVTAEDLFKEGMNAFTGEGLVPDIITASKLFDKAAKSGYAPAQVMRGLINLEPEATYDPPKSLYWFQLAAEQGNSAGQYNVACCFFWGVGVIKNEKEAMKWFRKAAEQGLTVAEYAFGYCLLTDVSADADTKQGIPWLFKAAKKEFPAAMYLLGVMVETGDMTPNAENPALRWPKGAEAKPYDPRDSNLAVWCDTNGNPAPQTFYRIVESRQQWFNNGIIEVDFFKPKRVESNGAVTFKIENEELYGDSSKYADKILKAIEEMHQGTMVRNSDAELWWGQNLVTGTYLEKNPHLALPWLRRAAEQGHRDAKKWIITAIQNINGTAK